MDRFRMTVLAATIAFIAAAAASAQEAQQEQQAQQAQQGSSDQAQQNSSQQAQSESGATQTDRTSAKPEDAMKQQEKTTRQAAATRSGQEPAQGTAVAMPFVMFVVPVQTANSSQNPTEGECWAKLYDGENFTGDSFTLIGPVELSNMTGPFGVDWEDVSSIRTGSQANVTIYDNINFRDRAAKIASGKEVRELSSRLGFFEEVESLRIDCAQAKSAAG